MVALFDPARHEPMTTSPWRESAARAAIERITKSAVDEFDPARGWLAHPLDDPDTPDEVVHALYHGSGGVIWALEYLARVGAVERKLDFSRFVIGLAERNRPALQGGLHGTASYLLGDTGLWLLEWTFTHDAALAQRIFDAVQGNLDNPVREALWGSPGTMLAAIHMAETTAEPRWSQLVQLALQRLFDEMEIDAETGTWVWQQNLYGRRQHLLGAGHGFAGNVYPALRAGKIIAPGLRDQFMARALATLQATVLRADEGNESDDGVGGVVALANWHPAIDAQRVAGRLPLVQDCHGAPGIVCRLAGAPRSAEWDALLLAAGGLGWRAGPLVKGASLCHGTAGTAMACLALCRRTGDALWLQRARALGMHCIEQVETARTKYGRGRQSLWTGDLGVACTLWSCVTGEYAYPTLDVY